MGSSMIIRSADQWQDCFRFLERVTIPKSGLEVTWRPPRRSNAQNRYLNGVVYRDFARGLMDLGKGPVDRNGIHYICKEQFMPRVPVGTMGKTMPMSTTQLCRSGNEQAFSDYVEKIKELAASAYSIYIPDPNEEAN